MEETNGNRIKGIRSLEIDSNSRDLWRRISNDEVVDTINWFSLEYGNENQLFLSSVGENGLLEAKETLKEEIVTFLVVNGCLIKGKNDFRTITLLIAWIPRFVTGPKRARSILDINGIVKYLGMKIVYIIEPRFIHELTTKYVEKRINEIRGFSSSSQSVVIGRYLFTRESTERRRKESRKTTILPIIKELLFCSEQIEKVQRKGVERIFELFSTERFYMITMNYFIRFYVDEIRKHGYRDLYLKLSENLTVIIGVNTPMLRDFERIYEIKADQSNEDFMKNLRSLTPQFFTNEKISQIIDSFRKHCPNLKKYRNYSCLYHQFLHDITTLLEKDSDLKKSFTQIESKLKQIKWRSTTWNSFLIMPIQRPMRYTLLFKDLVKDTLKTRSQENHRKMKLALEESNQVTVDINKFVDEYSRIAKSKQLAKDFRRADLEKKKIVGLYPIKIHYSPPNIVSTSPEMSYPTSTFVNMFSSHQRQQQQQVQQQESVVTGNLLDFGNFDDNFQKQQRQKSIRTILEEEEEEVEGEDVVRDRDVDDISKKKKKSKKKKSKKYKIRNGELYVFEDKLIIIKFNGDPQRMAKNPSSWGRYFKHTIFIGSKKIYREIDLKNPNLRCYRHPKIGLMINLETEYGTLYLEIRGGLDDVGGQEEIDDCLEAVEVINAMRNKCVGKVNDYKIMKNQITYRILHRSKMIQTIIPHQKMLTKQRQNQNQNLIADGGLLVSLQSTYDQRRDSDSDSDSSDSDDYDDRRIRKMCWVEVTADLRVKIYESSPAEDKEEEEDENSKKMIHSFSIVDCVFGKTDHYQTKRSIRQSKQQQNKNLVHQRSKSSADLRKNKRSTLQVPSKTLDKNNNSSSRTTKRMSKKKKRKSFSGYIMGTSGNKKNHKSSRRYSVNNNNNNNNNNNINVSTKTQKHSLQKFSEEEEKMRNKLRYCWFYISPKHTGNNYDNNRVKRREKHDNVVEEERFLFQTNGSIVDLENWIGILEMLNSNFMCTTKRRDDKNVTENFRFMSQQQQLMIGEEQQERSEYEKKKKRMQKNQNNEKETFKSDQNVIESKRAFNYLHGINQPPSPQIQQQQQQETSSSHDNPFNFDDLLQSGFEVKNVRVEERFQKGSNKSNNNFEDEDVLDFFKDVDEVEEEIIVKGDKKKEQNFFY